MQHKYPTYTPHYEPFNVAGKPFDKWLAGDEAYALCWQGKLTFARLATNQDKPWSILPAVDASAAPNCAVFGQAPADKPRQACTVRQQPLHDSHCAVWFTRIVDAEFPMLDRVSYTLQPIGGRDDAPPAITVDEDGEAVLDEAGMLADEPAREYRRVPTWRVFREHPLVTGEPIAEDDSGGHASDCAGMPPAGFPRDVSITVVHSHRTMSRAARDRQHRLRATFGIADVIANHLNDGQQKRRGRPSAKQANNRFRFAL